MCFANISCGTGIPGCVITIQKGVNAMSAEKRLARKRSFIFHISHRRGLKWINLRLKPTLT